CFELYSDLWSIFCSCVWQFHFWCCLEHANRRIAKKNRTREHRKVFLVLQN
ncbi:unnamed protein product, partial [Brassica oleracea]